MTSISVLVASSDRPTLERTLASVRGQLCAGDELLVDVNNDSPGGGRARNRLMAQASGAWLSFMDDDDVYTPDALQAIREHVNALPGGFARRAHLFRMRFADGRTLWDGPRLEYGNVGTPMIVVPNVPGLGRWGEAYGWDDWKFISETCETLGAPVWCEPTIALIRP